MIAMPPLIPAAVWNALSLAIARGATDQVQDLVEENNLNVNAFLDDSSWMPILMEVLLSNGFPTEPERLPLLRYLLKKGANPNICCKKGYNCFHIAVQQEKYICALELFLSFDADVNVVDGDGSNVVYWAIQGFLLRKEGTEEPEAFLRVLEKILLLGADLDHTNRYDMNAREWLNHAAPAVQQLVARWEAGKPAIRPAFTTQPKFPTNLHYAGLVQKIWNGHASPDGPAATVSGKLLGAIETLREEAQRNGNVHYRSSHKQMAVYVRDTLVKSGVFDKTDVGRIITGTKKLMKGRRPYKEDDVYDLLVDEVCIFYKKNEDI